MLHGDWGYSFISRVDVDTLIWQRVPVTLAIIGASQLLALALRCRSAFSPLSGPTPGSTASPALWLCRFFAADFFHRHPADPAVLDHARLAALRLSRRHQRYRLAVVVGALRQSLMPVAVLGLFQGQAGHVSALGGADVIRLDYVTTARSKGLRERVVVMNTSCATR